MKYPIMLDITRKKVVIIGGGKVALRKIMGLLDAGADILVVGLKILPEIKALDVQIMEEAYRSEHLKSAFMIFICTDNLEVNQLVLRDRTPGQLVNDTTNQANSDFFNMATVTKNELTVGISTGGNNPGYAKKVKREVSELVDNLETEEIGSRNKNDKTC
ncbi:bifunctional precorrin-2 dehydrogenase/sirohydrochlorin ferrochelatase [Listeria monocytogenes]|uniref:precorrin-2 dehydrogenase/sirohydrochlorin ferrochelatase family protein n=1 Tax=Listeria monocytogenes TaxID=1639 RepID=UPI0010DFFE21|nr:bifunctional precorrin-2 dehydrogenase/sirohydrochlorin ferrochelatase [Listeria monocytogenes]EAC7885384.1 bifunctional precorrin-2 dehydrogenase/sirohydrochlorin ferrochelatase [Listeria monocytogenes]EAE0010760.1 bifunctional precorrin-2 dehydrogenase/sirohydrochlorin ferrochelatase [Listeria monocytogenes]EAG2314732.1 bifunctional precorrin-2 dehydrogenase/sirohydrochlorin ferrochelatase [Listeria monocytogenes]EAK8454235.1 bifunctional precorrin-2 dehydrogenase/sirohydrochlorin ferroche